MESLCVKDVECLTSSTCMLIFEMLFLEYVGQNTLSAYILCHCYPVVLIHILSPYSPSSSLPHCFVFLAGYCAYLDVENAMNPSFAESMGVNVDNLLISPPDSAENLLSMVNTLTKSGSMDVIVVDSVCDHLLF